MEKDAAHEFPAEFYQAFAGAGWLGITTPEEYGGHGFGITEASLLLEEGGGFGGATEPEAGLDTTRITTFARRDGSDYVVNGRKVWISKALESEKILLLTRTTKFADAAKKTDGLTLFLTDLDRARVDI